jgi:hypothetical protein
VRARISRARSRLRGVLSDTIDVPALEEG